MPSGVEVRSSSNGPSETCDWMPWRLRTRRLAIMVDRTREKLSEWWGFKLILRF